MPLAQENMRKAALAGAKAIYQRLLMQAMCVGKNKCVIETKALNQPDPCSGHHKRVAVVATGCSAVALPKRKSTTTFISSTGGGTLSYCNRQDAGLDGQPFVQNVSSGPLVSTSISILPSYFCRTCPGCVVHHYAPTSGNV